jgi:desampylase
LTGRDGFLYNATVDQQPVTVPPRIVAGLRRHAAVTLPAECCGALIGEVVGGCIEVRSGIPLANDATDHYEIDAATVLRLERQAGHIGYHVVGFYHSHPASPPLPSATDLAHAVPGYVYLIVSALDGCVRAWRLRDDRSAFSELNLRTPLAGAA